VLRKRLHADLSDERGWVTALGKAKGMMAKALARGFLCHAKQFHEDATACGSGTAGSASTARECQNFTRGER
jgi:hypothetical protein